MNHWDAISIGTAVVAIILAIVAMTLALTDSPRR